MGSQATRRTFLKSIDTPQVLFRNPEGIEHE